MSAPARAAPSPATARVQRFEQEQERPRERGLLGLRLTRSQSICSRMDRASAIAPPKLHSCSVKVSSRCTISSVADSTGSDDGSDRQYGRVRQRLVGDRTLDRAVDEVDQDVAVERLDEPVLRRSLGAQSGLGQRLQRAAPRRAPG